MRRLILSEQIVLRTNRYAGRQVGGLQALYVLSKNSLMKAPLQKFSKKKKRLETEFFTSATLFANYFRMVDLCEDQASIERTSVIALQCQRL